MFFWQLWLNLPFFLNFCFLYEKKTKHSLSCILTELLLNSLNKTTNSLHSIQTIGTNKIIVLKDVRAHVALLSPPHSGVWSSSPWGLEGHVHAADVYVQRCLSAPWILLHKCLQKWGFVKYIKMCPFLLSLHWRHQWQNMYTFVESVQ